MKTLIVCLLVVLMAVTVNAATDLLWWKIFGTGDLPNSWAQKHRTYYAERNATDQHWLAEVLGCVTDERLRAGQTVQCGEVFVYLRPHARVQRVLGSITNIQSSGYVQEARGTDTRIGTLGDGRVDRAVLHDGLCYGNVGDCIGLRTDVIEFGHGWRLESSPDGIRAVRR